MRPSSVLLFLPWVFTSIFFASADTPAAPDLSSQIQKARSDIAAKVNGTPAANADKAAIHQLDALKIQLVILLDQDISQLKKDQAVTALSSSTQAAIAKMLADDQAEQDALNNNLGKWNTEASTPPTTQTATQTQQPANMSLTTTATKTQRCVIQAAAPQNDSDHPGNTAYVFTSDCAGGSPTAIAVGPSTGNLDIKTMTVYTKTGLNAPQYSAGHKFMSFVVPAGSTVQSFQIDLPNSTAKNNGVRGTYYISTGTADIATCESAPSTAGCFSGPVQLPGTDRYAVNQVFQGLAGIAVSGASATDPRSTFDAEGKLDLPLTSRKDNNIAAKFDLTSYAKIGAIGQLNSVSSLFSTTTSAFTTVLSNPPEKVVQSYEMGGSVGWSIPHTLWKQADNVFTLSVIGGGGMITPLSPDQVQPAVYIATDPTVQNYFETNNANNNSNLPDQFKTSCSQADPSDPTGKKTLPCYVQVYPADRLQFFRQYGGGLRLKFYAKDSTPGHADYRFPGNLDLTVGQNEYVSAGRLHGPVLHFGGEIPVPGADYVYLTVGMDSSFVKRSSSEIAPLLLSPGSNATINPATIVNVAQPQQNRDRYSVGVSFDLAHLLSHGNGTTATATPPPTISTQPLSQAIQENTAASLLVSATGSGSLSYQWYEGKSPDMTAPIAGATGSSFKTPNLTAAKSYWVLVTNTANGTSTPVDSGTADITIKPVQAAK